MAETKRKALMTLMSVALAFSMTSATALTAFADQLSAGVIELQATSASKPAVYTQAYGVFGGGYSLMFRTVQYTTTDSSGRSESAYDWVEDIVKTDGSIVMHTSSDESPSVPDGYPSNEAWSNLAPYKLSDGVIYDAMAGYVGVKSKKDGKCGVNLLDGSVLIPRSYDYILANGDEGFIALTDKGSSLKIDFLNMKGKSCGSFSIAVAQGSSDSYYYGYRKVRAGYIWVNGRTKTGSYISFAAKKQGSKYVCATEIKEVINGSDAEALMVETDGFVHYVSANGADVKLGKAENQSGYIDGKFISLGRAYYSVSGAKIALDESYEWVMDGGVGSYALFRRYDSSDNKVQVLVDASGNVVKTFSASEVVETTGDSYMGGSCYTVSTKSGEGYNVSLYAASGKLKKALGTSKDAERLRPVWNVDKTQVVGYSGKTGYYDANFNSLKDMPAALQKAYKLSGKNVLLKAIPKYAGASSHNLSVTDSSGKVVKVAGKTLAAYPAYGEYASLNNVKHAGLDVWWAQDSSEKWGAIDSSGKVQVPFKFDSYCDMGEHKSNCVLVCKDGVWELFNVSAGALVSEMVNISGSKVSGIGPKVYTGQSLALKPTVKRGFTTLKQNTNYTLSYLNASKKSIAASKVVNVGTYYVVITGKGKYNGSITKSFKVTQAANPMNVVAKAASVKYNKKAQTVKASGAYNFKKKAVGAVTYARVAKGSSKWLSAVNKKTGAITVKAGAPKGKTQAVKVKVTAAGNANYKSLSKTVTVKVKVK